MKRNKTLATAVIYLCCNGSSCFVPSAVVRARRKNRQQHTSSLQDISSEDVSVRSSTPLPLQRRNSRHCRRRHDETVTTAAGVEKLFSLTLWRSTSSSFVRISKQRTSSHEVTISTTDLPSIDCEWACQSDVEILQLRQMKLLLHTDLQPILNSNLHETYPDVYGDLRLLRFLRKSKERDANSASLRYRSFLKWRIEEKVDSIRAMVENACNNSQSLEPSDEKLQTLAEYFPCNFEYMLQEPTDDSRKDIHGAVRPAILHIGNFDTTRITAKIQSSESDVSLRDFLNYWIYLYEAIHRHLYHQSIRVQKMTFLDEVCDLTNLSIKQFSPAFVTKVMKPWLKMTQSHYPETTRRIYVLKPPAIVNFAWRLVTPLLSQGTVDKIQIVGDFEGSADDFCKSTKTDCSSKLL